MIYMFIKALNFEPSCYISYILDLCGFSLLIVKDKKIDLGQI